MANRTRVYALVGLVGVGVLVTSPTAWAADPGPEHATEWRDKTPISVNINTPNDPYYFYVPAGNTRQLTATATDIDQYCVDDYEVWYDYSDDVTSGTTKENHHMWWTASEGDCEDPYGTSTTYIAPDYAAGGNLRPVTMTVYAVDFNIGAGETSKENPPGFPDTASGTASVTLYVWQIWVSKSQSGFWHPRNEADYSIAFGMPTLGWIVPQTPPEAFGYFANTEFTGTIPMGPNTTTGFQWHQKAAGSISAKVLKPPQNIPGWEFLVDRDPEDEEQWFDDSPYPERTDTDSRYPNGTGFNYRQIFAVDGPGFITELTNDRRIGDPDFWTDYFYDMHLQTWVEFGGERISNVITWSVVFILKAQNQQWTITAKQLK